MKESTITSGIVPKNTIGKAVDLEQSVTEATLEDAMTTYKRACKRLLNPRTWHQLSGALSASFKLETPDNSDPHRLAQIHDYLRIDIPAPGPATGDGHDWVQVNNIADNPEPSADESFGLTLIASVNPAKPEKGTAHFFREGASSTFIIKRNGNTVTTSYHGRNEKPNTKDGTLGDIIRNTVIATGAMVGLSELQWTALIKGFLEKEIGG